jgi:capsular exopolysaccharide synthesis family protein
MNDLTPVPPSEPGFQLMEPMANNHAPAAAKFRLQKFLFFLRKFWWIPVVTLALSLSTAIAIFSLTPPTFVSYGNMWETERLRLPEGAAFTYDRENYIGTMIELLRGSTMREMTTNYLKEFNTNEIVLDKDGHILDAEIQVFASPKSSLYTIEARTANPAFTQVYLNTLMDRYLDYRENARSGVSTKTMKSISTEIQNTEEELNAAKAALGEYERSNNFAVLQEESAVESSYLVKLKTELSDYQLQTMLLAARELELDSGATGTTNASDAIFESLRNAGSAASFTSSRLDAAKEIELLKLQREKLAKYLRPLHPKMVKLDEDIARAQKLIVVYHQQNHEEIVAARQALQIKIDSVEQFIQEWEAKVASANARLAQANTLNQDILTKQRMYDRLVALSDNVRVSKSIDDDTLAINHVASPAKRSYQEAKSLLSQSIILGLGLGLGIVLLIAIRDDRFSSLVEVTERFGDNVVGQVPEISGTSATEPLGLLEGNDDRHIYAESYRNLRSALLYLAVEGHRPKVLLITSAVPNEGKSTIATNLARALALGGSKVLLVDGDLRKGHIHELLKLPSRPGLSELLRQPDDPALFIQATDLEDFSFLSRGGLTRNPGDLFLSPAFDQILARLREQYDYVLIDSSPVFAADDTSTFAPKVDGTLFVVRSRFSNARVVREALETLFQRQARVLGLILNRADPSARSYYFYKYAGYYSSANGVKANIGS